MWLPVRQVAEFLGLESASTAIATGWSVDSRTLQAGDVYFALRGPNHDGHDYAAEVLEKGAAAVVVERVAGEISSDVRVLRVEDSWHALQRVARSARQVWGGSVVGVTGSAGKTTTKDVIAEMLSEGYITGKTVGNLNNHVGVPLSLLRLDREARIAVLEIGMNHAGEIRDLASIASPQTGVVTNVGWAHMEAFDSIEGIAAAKRELIEALPADGTAVLNADDPRVAAFAQTHSGPTVLYGQSPAAQVRAEEVEYSLDGSRFRVGEVEFESSLTGRHSVSNILAGIAVAGVYGIVPHRLTQRVRNLRPGKMRGERFQHGGVWVYDDCYNSNPDAVRAMLDVLRDTPANKRIAVLGEMLELGRWSERLHRDVGQYAAACGIDVLVGIHGATSHMLDAAQQAGLPSSSIYFFDRAAEAGRLVRSLAEPGDAILFKGSRGIHVEQALDQFLKSAWAKDGEGGTR